MAVNLPLVFSCSLFLLFSRVVWSQGDFSRFKFIDQLDSNYLFRSNSIVYNGVVQYDWVIEGIRQAANASNITLPKSFFLWDYCLLEVELSDWKAERDYFQSHIGLGQFIHDPVIGGLEDPMWYPESIRKVLALDTPSLDNIPHTISQIRSFLYGSPYDPAVVLVHCEAGKDRTGEVAGAYAITYQNITFNQALYYDNKCVEGSRDIETFSKWGLEWYCWYLKYGGAGPGYENLDCEPNPSYVGHC